MTDAPASVPRMSPSRLDKVETCARAYAFRYVDKIKAPDKPTAAFGAEVHLELETYYRTRQLPAHRMIQIGTLTLDVGQCAIAGLQYLPLPDPSLEIECEWEETILSGPDGAYVAMGKIDVYDRRRVRAQHVREDGTIEVQAFEIGDYAEESDGSTWNAYDAKGRPIPLVIDHKTTGDFKWLKTADVLRGVDGLRGDAQAGFYGLKAIEDFRRSYGEDPECVHFRWVWYLRQEGESRARPVDLRMTPDEIRAIVRAWNPATERAHELHKIGKGGHETPPNLAGCTKYGGCEYGPAKKWAPGNLNLCRLSDGERLRASMSANIPLSQQVAAFVGGGQPAPQAPAAGSPFGGQAPAAGSPFGGQAPAAGSPFGSINPPEARAPASSPFGAVAVAPTGAGSPFGAVAVPSMAPPAAPSFGPFGVPAIPAVFPVAPPVDPRIGECHPSIEIGRRVEFLAWCDANNVDHKTGQPRAVASIPVATVPPAQAEADMDATLRGLAHKLYAAGRAPDPVSAHPQVTAYYNALVTMNGPPKGAAPAVAPTEPKRRGRKPRAATDTTPDGEEDDSPQIVITVKAIDEMIAFLTSLKSSAPA